jgi:hypothetical protein
MISGTVNQELGRLTAVERQVKMAFDGRLDREESRLNECQGCSGHVRAPGATRILIESFALSRLYDSHASLGRRAYLSTKGNTQIVAQCVLVDKEP